MSAAAVSAEVPELVRAVLHHYPTILTCLRQFIPEPVVTRTWRRNPGGDRVTLTIACAPAEGERVVDALVARLRYLGFYADVAGDGSAVCVRLSGYYGTRV